MSPEPSLSDVAIAVQCLWTSHGALISSLLLSIVHSHYIIHVRDSSLPSLSAYISAGVKSVYFNALDLISNQQLTLVTQNNDKNVSMTYTSPIFVDQGCLCVFIVPMGQW